MQQDMEALVQVLMRRIFIQLEASGRHVHLTQNQAQFLFGHDLTPDRPLSQPGQYLAKERVTLIGPKGRFDNVAVLGPARKEAQVELSLTDGKILGITPPVRPSGNICDTPGIILSSEKNTLALRQGVIAAQRHLHLTPETAVRFGLSDQQVVRLQVFTDRPLVFEDVLVRVHPDFADRAHLDYDEANACGMQKGDWGQILP